MYCGMVLNTLFGKEIIMNILFVIKQIIFGLLNISELTLNIGMVIYSTNDTIPLYYVYFWHMTKYTQL